MCGVITGVGAGVGAGVAAGVGCGVGAGVGGVCVLAGRSFVYHLNQAFVGAHPFGIGIFADEQRNPVINGFQLELHRVCNFKAGRGGIFGQGVDVLLCCRPTV